MVSIFHLGSTLKLLYMRRIIGAQNAIGGGADIGFRLQRQPQKKPHRLTLGLQASDAFSDKKFIGNTPPPSAGRTIAH